VPNPTPPSTILIPPAGELRGRLALALREVDLLRRLIRVAEYATRYGHSADTAHLIADRQEVARG
jgi:hypothetical protein